MMKYKGYTGHVIYDDDARLFHGEVLGLRTVITFQGRTVDELEQAFKDSVEDYIEWCKMRGVTPEKAFSGNLHIRIPPTDHARLVQEAALKDMSLNAYVLKKLKE